MCSLLLSSCPSEDDHSRSDLGGSLGVSAAVSVRVSQSKEHLLAVLWLEWRLTWLLCLSFILEARARLRRRRCFPPVHGFFMDKSRLSKSSGLNGRRSPSVRESGRVRRFESRARTLPAVHVRSWLAKGRLFGHYI
jgi:hypothetical protein